jgi:alkylation response protein AidB-like acyl-CoA dehydrogenase
MEPDMFRESLRSWLDTQLTPDVIQAGRTGMEANLEVLRDWNRSLADAGWAAPAWPTQYGGRDAGIDEQLAWHEEMSRAEAPGPVNVIGVSNIAPAIMAWGTDEQQARFLRPMLRGDDIWSQGMSEPDAGSDLASLRTTAVRDGDTFLVNGQKVWNSLGHFADWCQLYVRTDPTAPKHKGISCLLVDLRTPGIEARPITTITGEQPFAELFFHDVAVPATALLGPLDQGWRVAMTTLSHERAGVARLHLALSRRLAELSADPQARAGLRHPVSRDRYARVYSQIACMRWMTDRSLAQARLGQQPSGSLGSLAKLAWSHADQQLADLAVDVIGLPGTTGIWAKRLAGARSTSIAGGTTEINKNIVAEQGLGLPRDR